ncbi:MAG: cation:proton antiporter, partial [Pseudomonadales bacterium]|nr:cation:proton antiporter [Pseudomonadales bacterium]
ALAEFGIVFLLFTVGLNYSLPQIHALRNTVLTLGTAQVGLTTLIVGLLAYFVLGLPAATAFVIGAVFAQSSTTVISNQLIAQGEENSRHGRLGVAMSVFQDVTAVPLLILIPVFGAAAGFATVLGDIALALAKAVLAFVAVLYGGRWLLRPLFHYVAGQRSAELFTLTVLLVSLSAGWATARLGLSMAFGAFLAGMMLGETEFRHQVEATIRPFRDVLLGLFFVGVGMLIDPMALPGIWHWVLFGTAVLLLSKILLVAQIVRWSGVDPLTAWSTALLLAVGGEFGFALLSLSLGDGAIDSHSGQIVLYSVLLSIIVAPFLIRYHHAIARRLTPSAAADTRPGVPGVSADEAGKLDNHVVICGYGRMGQSVGNFLEAEGIPYVALDLDSDRVRQAHLAGEPVFYGDASDGSVLDAVGIARARLVVIGHNDIAAARRILHYVRRQRPELPVMVRTADETHVEELRAAGATEVIPETLEASLMVAATALLLLEVPLVRVVQKMREQRNSHYRLLRESFGGHSGLSGELVERQDRLRTVVLPAESANVGQPLQVAMNDGVVVTAMVREGVRRLNPDAGTIMAGEDILVLFGSLEDLDRAERALLQ